MELVNIIKSFLGWCTLINIIFLLFSTLILTIFQDHILKIHSTLFNLDKSTLRLEYFKFLAIYKIIILFFNVIPYLVILIMS